jgi:hypothetical protein
MSTAEPAAPAGPRGTQLLADAGGGDGLPKWLEDRRLQGLVVAAVATIAAFAALLTGRVGFSSDQAVVGLMARDVLERGAHPVLYWGSPYGGTAEMHYVAALFAVFGAGVATFRAGMLALSVAIVVCVQALTRLAFGARAGLAAGLFLACGPFYFFAKTLTSDGDYASLTLFSAVALLALLAADRRVLAGRAAGACFAGFGCAAGLAWWTMPLASSLMAASALAVAFRALGREPEPRSASRRDQLRALASGTGTAAVGFVVGAFPWLYHNARTGWASLTAAEMTRATPQQVLINLRDLLRRGWPLLFGASGRGPTLISPWPVAVLVAGIVGVVCVHGARRVKSDADPARRLAALLFVVMVVLPPLLAVLAHRTRLGEPRYLLLSYLGFFPLLGSLAAAVWRSPFRRVGVLAAALAIGPLSWLHQPAVRSEAELLDDPVPLVRLLEQRGVHAGYASYWLSYRTDFMAPGRVVLSPFGNDENGFVRDPTLAAQVDAQPEPAFLFCCRDLVSFESYLAARPVAHSSEDLLGYRLYRNFPPAFVAQLRASRTVPLSLKPTQLTWLTVDGPASVATGSTSHWRLVVKNDWVQALPLNTHASYHWQRPDGSYAVFNGLRTAVEQRIENGPTITIDAKVLADVPPGTYTLRFDLVLEGWSWFEEFGIASPSVAVKVVPSSP